MKIIPLDPISPAKAIAISGSRACPASSMKKWVKNPEKFHQLFMAVEIQLIYYINVQSPNLDLKQGILYLEREGEGEGGERQR